MRKQVGGYKYRPDVCPKCGCTVSENWVVRRLKSGCKAGKREE